jgi:hypothetical protein
VLLSAAAAACLLGAAGVAVAAPTSTAANGPINTFSVSGSDLANAGSPTFSSIAIADPADRAFSSHESMLVDGGVYDANGHGNTVATLTPAAGGAVVTITLDTGTNTLGYDITSIVSLTGTGQSRAQQSYDVHVSQVGSGGFGPSPLFSVRPDLPGNVDLAEGEVQVTTTDTGGTLATGVDHLQITFFDVGTVEPEMMYREFDVFGAPTPVPEPASLGLLASGGLGLLAGRRRRR